MTLAEFTHILETYGSNAQRWPESDRANCLELVNSNPQAKSLMSSFVQLDSKLDAISHTEFPGLETRVLAQSLPPKNISKLDKFIAWLLPESDPFSSLWRPALTACLPLVFGIVVGNFYSFDFEVGDDGFQYWDDELLMLSFNDYSENQP